MLSKNSATPKPVRRKFELPVSVRLIGGLAALVLLGSLLLMLPISAKNEALSLNKAIFTAVSALSVTGLSIITPSTDLTPFGKVVLMLLIQAGGIGYMVFAVLVFRILGRSISLTDRMALQDALGLLNLSGIVELTRRIVFTVLAIELIGGIALYFHWSQTMPDHRAAFFAMFHSVSAFCNAGFDLFAGVEAFPDDPTTLTIMGSLIFLGGLGIPVLFDLLTYKWQKRLSLHTKLTLITVAGLVVWGMVSLMITEARPGGVLAGLPVGRQAGLALFQSISCRTAGFIGLPDFADVQDGSILLMTTLMFIGCAPASMGGGITTGTFTVLVLALVAYVRRGSTPILQGRAIPGEMVRKAAAVLTISLAAVLTSSWLIMVTHGSDFETTIFEVVSAFATCGLTLDFTNQLNPFGQAIIILMMFWGRLGALTILFAFTRQKAIRRVNFPEEKVLIG